MKTLNIKNTISLHLNSLKTSVLLIGFSILSMTIISNAHGQDQLVSIDVVDVELEQVLNEIRDQTDISFIYNHEELSGTEKVSVTKSQATVEQILDIVLKGTGLSYEKVDNTIVIKPEKRTSAKSDESEKQKQTIRGKVRDKDSKSPLSFATIRIIDSDPVMGTMSDLDGNFAIEEVPVGRYSLKVSFVGYTDAIISDILLGSGLEAVVMAELSEKVDSLGEVVIAVRRDEPVNDMAIINARAFNAEETERYAATVGDPGRMAQVYAGVSGTDDASNEIAIRGNSPNWLLWRLEGVEIPSPNHFAEEGYSAGAISILSINVLGSSDFYTGAFPAEYGNALSGVFDINLRKGNNQRSQFMFQAGVLGIDASIEGPFKKGYGGSYLLNYRYSTLSLLNTMGVEVSENALPKYQDLTFKVNLPTKKLGTFSFWGIGGISESDEKYIPDTTNGEDPEDGYIDLTKTGMYAFGMTHSLLLDSKSYIRTVLSRSKSSSSQDLKEMDEQGNMNDEFYDDLENNATRINSFYNRKFSNRLTFRVGVGINFLQYNYYTHSFEDNSEDLKVYLDSEGKTQMYQAYSMVKYKISDALIVTGGLHYTHFALSQDNSLEPRLGLRYELPKGQAIGLGYGKHTRHEQLPVYFVENQASDGTIALPNQNLKLTRSHHFMASYERPLCKDAFIKAEVYYQHIPNLPVPTNPDKYWSPIFGGIDPDDTLANIGTGMNYGIELTVKKRFSNNYYFLITSSLFESKYKAADGVWRDTRYNIHYINNFVGGKEFSWGDNKMVGLNGKIIWSGGKRITPIDLDASIEEGEAVYDTDQLFSTQARDYFRLDIGVKLRFFRERSTHIVSLDVQNLTNRLNTWSVIYDPENQQVEEYPMAGLIPILSYRIEL
jgi:hypothetical protein